MRSCDYVVQVKRTFNPDLTPEDARLNYALGVSNEMLEVIEAREKGPHAVFDELGDVAWYTAASASLVFNVETFPLENEPRPSQVFPRPLRSFENLISAVRSYSEMVKKHVFHGKHFDDLEYMCTLREIWCCLRDVAPKVTSHSLDAVLRHNVEKLRMIWPDGFIKGQKRERDKAAMADLLHRHFYHDRVCTTDPLVLAMYEGRRLPGDAS